MKNIRNFSIIAHIDHGKTTLTDRLLTLTDTIKEQNKKDRLLDSNPIEQERGITIKLAPVRMTHKPDSLSSSNYILNLIDTPGHVDFSYEVSRSLSACEGAVLVIDASSGIQAQTVANYQKAKAHNLHIIPVINKIDLDNARPNIIANDLVKTFDFKKEEIIFVSAKTGKNVNQVLSAIIKRIPPPQSNSKQPLKALIFNSIYHPHKGVIAFLKVIEGSISSKNLSKLYLQREKLLLESSEIGYFTPHMQKTSQLKTGEVGYVATGLKDIRKVKVGETLTTKDSKIKPIPGFKKPKPMVFADLYPEDASQHNQLSKALEKLSLHDASLTYTKTASPALGNGFRVGYLGILHSEIVAERLLREFNLDTLNTSPSVTYKITLKDQSSLTISSASDFPDPSTIQKTLEPMIRLSLFTPEEYLGNVMKLAEKKRGAFITMKYLGEDKLNLKYTLPLSELISNFYDYLKSSSSGFASLEYQHQGFQEANIVKVDILLNKELNPPLSFLTIESQAYRKARLLAQKLKQSLPPQQFAIPIQAAIGGKIIARETVKAVRKDVTAKLYGGDRTRRMKLLEKQKKGKKRLKRFGSVEIPQEAFTEILKL